MRALTAPAWGLHYHLDSVATHALRKGGILNWIADGLKSKSTVLTFKAATRRFKVTYDVDSSFYFLVIF